MTLILTKGIKSNGGERRFTNDESTPPPSSVSAFESVSFGCLARVAVEVLEQSYLNSGVVSSLTLFSSDLSLNGYYAFLH